MIELDYDATADSAVDRAAEVILDAELPIIIRVQAATVSGRKQRADEPKPNEDTFAVVASKRSLYAGVFDGCSSQKPIVGLKAETGARFASHFLRSYVIGRGRTPVGELLKAANRALLEKSLKLGGALEDVHTMPATTATMISVDASKRCIELAHVGDTFCLVRYVSGETKLLTIDRNRPYDEELFAQIRSVASELHVPPRLAKQDPRIKQAVMDMFQDSYNRPDGTGQGVVNGDPHMEQYMQVLSLPLGDVAGLLLGSDGIVPAGWDETHPGDQRKLFEIASKDGAKGLISTKQQSEDADPDWHHTRFKHSDDGTAVYIEFQR